MKHFAALSGLVAIAAAAPFYPKPSGYPHLPTGALPPSPPGSGVAHPTAPLYPIPTGAPMPPPSGSGFPGFPPMPTGSGFPMPSGSGIFPIGPVGTGTAPPFPMPTGTAPYPYKREAQMESFSFPSISLPTGGSGMVAPTGLPSISFPTGGFGGGSAAPTGFPGLGGGSGEMPSLSLPTGVAAPTGGFGEQRGYQGKIEAGNEESGAEESSEGDDEE